MGIGRFRKKREQEALAQLQSASPTSPSAPLDVALSLPPASADQPQVSSNQARALTRPKAPKRENVRYATPEEQPWGPGPKPQWWMPADSKVRKVALSIIAMRLAGMEEEDIAKQLHMSRKSLNPYVYRAGKNGWLKVDDAKAAIDYELMPKVVKNLHEGLDSDARLNNGMRERTHVALKVAEGTIFKEYGDTRPEVLAQTMVAIRIEMPAGPQQQIREGTLGGTPSFVEGDVVPQMGA